MVLSLLHLKSYFQQVEPTDFLYPVLTQYKVIPHMDAQSRIKELVLSAYQSVMQKKKDSLRILLTTPTQIQMHMCRLLYLFWGVVS